MPSEIRGEIRQHGGLVAKRSEDQSKVIKLIHHHYKGNDYCVSVKFVLDSIAKNKLQDITQYEFNPDLKGKDQPVLKLSNSDKKSKSPKKVQKRQKDEESKFNTSFLAPRSSSTPSGTDTAAGVSLRSSKSAPSGSSKVGRVHFETNSETPSTTNVSPILDQPNLNKSPIRSQEVKVIINKSPAKPSSQNKALAPPSQPAQHSKDVTSKQFSENIPIERVESYSSVSSETLPPIRKLIEKPPARLSQPVPLPYTVSQLMNETLSLSQRIEDAKYLGMADANVPDPNRARKAPNSVIIAPQPSRKAPNQQPTSSSIPPVLSGTGFKIASQNFNRMLNQISRNESSMPANNTPSRVSNISKLSSNVHPVEKKMISRSVAPQNHSSTSIFGVHGQQPAFTESSQKRKLIAIKSLNEVESLQASKLARIQPSGSPSKPIKIRSTSNVPIVNYPNSAQKTPVAKKPLVNYPKSTGSPTKSRPYNPPLDYSRASPNPLNMPSQTATIIQGAKQPYKSIVTYSKSNPSTPLGERKKGSQSVRFQSSSQPVAVKTPRSELRYSSASQPAKNTPTPIRAKYFSF